MAGHDFPPFHTATFRQQLARPHRRAFCCPDATKENHMAVKIIANYSKRLGLPGYSSHQFSVSVETELANTDNVTSEASRLHKTLKTAVDKEMQSTGFVPGGEYGAVEQAPALEAAPVRPHGNGSSHSKTWKASDKQRELVLKLVENANLDMEWSSRSARKCSATVICRS
jgi:hypothetical protein